MSTKKNRLRTCRVLTLCTTWVFVGFVVPVEVEALTIVRDFKGGSQPGNAAGGGDLEDIFDAAADWWEMAILDPHTVTIHFKWDAIGGADILAFHVLNAEGGVPHRETEGTITFDNDGSTEWFMDPTPHDNSEYTTVTEYSVDLGGGLMNTGREHTGATGNAVGRVDLLAVAKHEIGHALGLSAANDAFVTENGDGDIDLVAPRPHAGATIDTIAGAHLNLAHALMRPRIDAGIRRVQSAVDIEANAEISEFIILNINPSHAIPTLTEWGLIVLALSILSAGVVCIIRSKRLSTAGASAACMLICTGLVVGGAALARDDNARELRQAIEGSDVVVIGRVEGTVDKKPEAQSRKHLEAHWVTITRTLNGYDIAGLRVKVKPNGTNLEDGLSFVFVLKEGSPGGIYRAVYVSPGATEAQVATVSGIVAESGGKVLPKRQLRVRHVTGWSSTTRAELSITVDRKFEWRQLQHDRVDIRAGSLSSHQVANLIEQIRQTKRGPIADDAGVVTIELLNADGELEVHRYSALDGSPVLALLAQIETLARQSGAAP